MPRFAAKIVGAAVLASSLAVAVVPAEARSKRHWHRHHDRIDGGDILAGIVLIGAIAAIAGSGKKDREAERDYRDYRYDQPDEGRDYRAAPDGAQGGQWVPGSNSAEARAVDACSWAAEGELGENARVGAVDGVTRVGDGWRVTGSVAAPEMMPRDFACTYRNGRAVSVTFN
jgi:hypothetical protein